MRNAQSFQSTKQSNKLELTIQMINAKSALITGTFVTFTEQLKQIIKQDGEKGWVIPLGQTRNLMTQIRDYNDMIQVKTLPYSCYKIQEPLKNILKLDDREEPIIYTLEDEQKSITCLPQNLIDKLYEYQKECVTKGIQLKGRILIADEMVNYFCVQTHGIQGVGKTVQSIALASVYKESWPLLIICPSSLRLNWQDEILMWLKDVKKEDIQVCLKSKQAIRQNIQVLVISYDLCLKMKDFKIAIADECHYLKSGLSQRSQVCVPLLKQCKHVILLTGTNVKKKIQILILGTPALSKPRDLFNILTIIRPDIYSNFKEFGFRYCDPKLSRFTKGFDFDGATNLKELHYILKTYFMIRRLKKDVLSYLPQKRRIKIRIQTDDKIVKQIQMLIQSMGDQNLNHMVQNDSPPMIDDKDAFGAQQVLNKCYLLSGQAKIKGIKDYISELLENQIKFIFFAHHISILDEVQKHLEKLEVKHIRIDGSTEAEKRHRNVFLFQESEEIRVAVLGITAASTGITLTAASTVVFGEMHWTPATMLQAEDRAHRIGQESNVDCHYLLGDQTLDDKIYERVEKKFGTVSNFIDGHFQSLNVVEQEDDRKSQKLLDLIEEIMEEKKEIDQGQKVEEVQEEKKECENNEEISSRMAESSRIFDDSQIKSLNLRTSLKQKIIESQVKQKKDLIVDDQQQYKQIFSLFRMGIIEKESTILDQSKAIKRLREDFDQSCASSAQKRTFINFGTKSQKANEKISSTKKIFEE